MQTKQEITATAKPKDSLGNLPPSACPVGVGTGEAIMAKLRAAMAERKARTPFISDQQRNRLADQVQEVLRATSDSKFLVLLRSIRDSDLYLAAAGGFEDFCETFFQRQQVQVAALLGKAAGEEPKALPLPSAPIQMVDRIHAESHDRSSQEANTGSLIPKPGPTPSIQAKQVSAPVEIVEILHGRFKGKFKVHAVASMFHRVNGASREEMKKSLRRDGQQEPIVAHHGWILDGLCRIELLNELGLAPRVVQFAVLKSHLSPDAWIIAKNLCRRHLTDDQRLLIAARYLKWRKEEPARRRAMAMACAKRKSIPGVEVAPSNPVQAQAATCEFPQEPAENPQRGRGRPPGRRREAETLAKVVDQSRYRAEQAIKVRDQAPDLVGRVERGDLTLKEAAKTAEDRRTATISITPEAKDTDDPIEQTATEALRWLRSLLKKRRLPAEQLPAVCLRIAELVRQDSEPSPCTSRAEKVCSDASQNLCNGSQ